MQFGLDISHHQDARLDLARAAREGISFVVLKATEGAGWNDPEFAGNLTEARQANLLVAAYHYQRPESAAAQVANVRDSVPLDVPVILDVEAGSGSLALTRDIIGRLRTAGYRVPLLYLPRWYWQGLNSPSLAGLPPLWSSRYPDNVIGSLADEWADVPAHYWNGYGGLDVAVLQFTSSVAIAGHQPIDANAYRGTREQLAALLGGGQDDDMTSLDDTFTAGPFKDGWQGPITYKAAIEGIYELLFIGSRSYPWQGDSIPERLNAIAADVAELKKRPVADIDEPALAAALAERGIGGATAEQVKDAVRSVFARAGQPEE